VLEPPFAVSIPNGLEDGASVPSAKSRASLYICRSSDQTLFPWRCNLDFLRLKDLAAASVPLVATCLLPAGRTRIWYRPSFSPDFQLRR